MITGRRVKKLMRKNKLRRKHRRNIRKGNNDILPIILLPQNHSYPAMVNIITMIPARM